MNKTTEALKLSEEALLGSGYYDTTQQRKALAAIREARAEQEKQEPVAWQFFEDGKWWIGSEYNHHRQLTEEAGYPIRELYAAPVRTKDLTDAEIDEFSNNLVAVFPTAHHLRLLARAVIAADREKNKC